MRKKMVSRIAALSLALSFAFVAGCSSSSPPSASPSNTPPPSNQQSGGNEQQPSAPAELRRFTIFTSDVNTKKLPLDSPVANQVRDLYNVEFEWIVPAADARERLAIMLAGNESELPDLIYFNDRTMMQQYISAGKLLKMNDYLEEYAPNVVEINYKNFYDRLKDKDGGVYFLPRYYTVNSDEYNYPENTTSFWMKSEFFDETDSWDLVPIDTLDDMTNVLRMLKEHYPDQWPISLALGANGRINDIISYGAGCSGLFENNRVIREDGELMYIFQHGKIKEYFKWLNSLNQEGLLDIESPMLSLETLREKVLSGQVYSSLTWGFGSLRTPYKSYQESQDEMGKIMFFNFPALDQSVTQHTNTRGPRDIYTYGLAATVNLSNPEDFFRFYSEANTEDGHFNILGTVDWDYEGENTVEATEGYNFILMREALQNGQRPMYLSSWTNQMWADPEWGWQWGVESLIEFTYNLECNVPNAKYDILENMEGIYNPDDKETQVLTHAGWEMLDGRRYREKMRDMWIDVSEIAGLILSDDAVAVRAAMDVVTDRIVPRIIMAENDAAFEREYENLLSELDTAGLGFYMDAYRSAYEERLALWNQD